MKRLIFVILLMLVTSIRSFDLPFKRGVNLTGWLQTSNARQIQFTKFTKQDFINIKSLGCDVIRLPINLHFMTTGAPDYTIDPLFFYFLDQIIDWAEELQIHLLLDNHTFDPATDTAPNVDTILMPVWKQIATRYKGRSNFLYYEVLNEPHGITDAKWNEIQLKVVAAIRAIDQKHTIIVGPAGWNSYNNLKFMSTYPDNNLIYTFHFYDPFLFTHQGASWTDPSMVPLSGVPFPYDAARMPPCPPELKNTWIESNLNYYKTDGTIKRVKELIDIAVDFKNKRKVPIFCGEFGVYIPNSDNADRIYWYQVVREYLEEKGIAWTIWDYTGGFGIFEQGGNDLFEYDLNIPLIGALGLNEPPQQEFVIKPDATGYDLYLDFMGQDIFESSSGEGLLDYYSEDNPVGGKYCIHWTGVEQYRNIGFDFKPNKDMSLLVKNGYAIDFWVRGNTKGIKIDMRFIDTKTTAPTDHPWRMRFTLDEQSVAWDGDWYHLQIPLKNFKEHGSWDGTWFNPIGAFDWRAIDRFEIVSEHSRLDGVHLYFDNIRIVDPKINEIPVNKISPKRFELHQNYPNPFNAGTKIGYELGEMENVALIITNAIGQKVSVLVNEIQFPGKYFIIWDGMNESGQAVSSGVYFCTIKIAGFLQQRKMILMR